MSPVTILSSDFPVKLKALSGQSGMHLGFPLHVSQMMTLPVFGCNVTAPYSQASMHHPQPLHFSPSTRMAPVSFCVMAFSWQAMMHGASLHALQVTAVLKVCPILTERILDLSGLNTFSFSNEQAYSQMSQPTHFSLSQLTCWLIMFKA
jgi:hypothetical protein